MLSIIDGPNVEIGEAQQPQQQLRLDCPRLHINLLMAITEQNAEPLDRLATRFRLDRSNPILKF